jgi:hypothetical protein
MVYARRSTCSRRTLIRTERDNVILRPTLSYVRDWPFATFSSAAGFGGYRSTTDIHPGLPVMSGLGRARRASVAERIQHVANLCGGEFRRHASRRILSGDVEGPLASMRIAAVLHPAVLLAFADRARFLQHGDRPAAQRPDRRSSLPLISIESLLPGTNPSRPFAVPRG